MKRRNVLSWMGVGMLAASLPVTLAACQSEDTPTADAPSTTGGSADAPEIDDTPREDGFAAIGTVSQLDEQGFISDKTFQGEQVLVVRDPADASSVIAVNSLCTHQGCSVDWEGGGDFTCACHGSAFAPDGSVKEGPATDPLGTFTAKIEDDLVLVNVG